MFKNKKIKIWKAETEESDVEGFGKIISVGEVGMKISTGKGNLIIKKISIGEKNEELAFDESKEIELTKMFDNSTIGENLD